MAHNFQSSQEWSRSSANSGQDWISYKAEKCISLGQDEAFLLEEKRSLHFPLTGGGTEGLPALPELDGIKVAPLGLAGVGGTTEGGEAGRSGASRAGEDGVGGGDVS
jgi:hypothetical protein